MSKASPTYIDGTQLRWVPLGLSQLWVGVGQTETTEDLECVLLLYCEESGVWRVYSEVLKFFLLGMGYLNRRKK